MTPAQRDVAEALANDAAERPLSAEELRERDALRERLRAWEDAGRAFETTHDQVDDGWPCAAAIRRLLAGRP